LECKLMDDQPPLMAGGFPILSPSVENMQLNMLIWGNSGTGKTTLAATAPGTKLFLMLDPGGELSLASRSDCAILGAAGGTPATVMNQLRAADPFGLGKVFDARPDIETLVVDSMTTLAYIALAEGVTKAGGNSTIEQPGQNGWGYRNQSLLRVTVNLMRLCAQYKRHLILITHEGPETQNEKGIVTSVRMALSNSVANQVGLRFNEIWHLEDFGTDRRIAIRPARSRSPMKTRMFVADKVEFVWYYNADTNTGEGIADWYHAWQANSGKKLALPSATTSTGGKK
jgi:AAA domain-containing protein